MQHMPHRQVRWTGSCCDREKGECPAIARMVFDICVVVVLRDASACLKGAIHGVHDALHSAEAALLAVHFLLLVFSNCYIDVRYVANCLGTILKVKATLLPPVTRLLQATSRAC